MAVKEWNGAASGFGTNANWTPVNVPANGDDVYYDHISAGDCAGSDQSAITLASFNAKMTNTFAVGTNGTPLKIGSTLWNIGQQGDSATDGAGSGRINLDGHTVAGVWNIY